MYTHNMLIIKPEAKRIARGRSRGSQQGRRAGIHGATFFLKSPATSAGVRPASVSPACVRPTYLDDTYTGRGSFNVTFTIYLTTKTNLC